MRYVRPLRDVVATLESGSVEELVRARTEYPELSQRVGDLLYMRFKHMERHRTNPWTQQAYDDLCWMLGELIDVVDDWRNITWVKDHCKFRELIALGLMVVEPVTYPESTLGKRAETGWITAEQHAARIRNEQFKLQRLTKVRRFVR